MRDTFRLLGLRTVNSGKVTSRLALFASLALFAGVAVAEEWPRWRGPRGDGSWFGPPLTATPAGGDLQTKWKVPLGPGYSGISVVGDRGYTMDKPADPTDSERVVCFDTKTGATRWAQIYKAPYGKLDYGSGPRCTPTVDGKHVYTLGAMGHVYCLNADNGEIVWNKDLMREYGAKLAEWGFAASIVLHGEKAIVHAGAENGSYIAFDRHDGREIWRAGNDPLGYGTPIVIRQGAKEQLVGWTPEHVMGIDVDDGQVLWNVPYKVTYGVSIATPIFHEQTVLVSGYWEGTKAIRLGPGSADAAVSWEENRNLRGLMSQPIYRDGHVYLLDKQHGVTCFRLADGQKLWTDSNRLTKRDRNPQINLIRLGDSDQVLCLNAEGEMILATFRPQGYEEHGRWPIIGPTWAHPALAGQYIYARDDSSLVCVELPVAKQEAVGSR